MGVSESTVHNWAQSGLLLSRSEMSRLSKGVAVVERLLSNQDKVQYEVQALRFGERGGSFTDCIPVPFRISWNSAVNKGSRSWIRYRFLIRKPSPASQRFLATWLIQSPFA